MVFFSENLDKNACQVCNSSEWLDLPNPVMGQTVTTAGRIIQQSLGKAQCSNCGFVQRIREPFLGLTNYYEQDYENYYERPGTFKFHLERYRILVNWMVSFLNGCKTFDRILDVGCGQGWAMEEMHRVYPQSVIEGLEPSQFNVEVARRKGFVAYEGKLPGISLEEGVYDLVYSNNVIQHVSDARLFLESLKKLVKADGLIVITCPDGSRPNIELLWGDQNFSFLPIHLVKLCRDIGFSTVFWSGSSLSSALPSAQLLLLCKGRALPQYALDYDAIKIDVHSIYEHKCKYLSSFSEIEEYLNLYIKNFSHTYNFGSSYWSSILAAYCPSYWREVSSCLIDGKDENSNHFFLGKEVKNLVSIPLKADDGLVLGTSPVTHTKLRDRFLSCCPNIISWDQYIAE